MEFYQDAHNQTLEKISGVTFTCREIEIIAFLISGRTTKRIASFLSISPKTVDNHIHNIMSKLECHSRESIIDFIEKSGKLSTIRQYYSTLLIKTSFINKLKKISQITEKKVHSCIFIPCYDSSQQDLGLELALIRQLRRYLTLAGIVTSLKSIKQCDHLPHSLNNGVYHIVLVVLGEELKGLFDLSTPPPILKLVQRLKQGPPSGFFSFLVLNRDSSMHVPQIISDIGYVELQDANNNYLSVLYLLKKIYSDVNFDKVISKFMQECALLNDSSDVNSYARKVLQKNIVGNVRQFVFKIGKRHLLSFVFSLCFFYMLFLMVNNNPSFKTTEQFIRSDLIMPFEDTMLERPDLHDKIEKSFKGAWPLKATALIGIAGAGKTTLARQYAHKQKASVIWELNAETKETLTDSFENLAQALSVTAEDQRALREIQEIKDSKKRKVRIFQFVRGHLRSQKDWILIYDNVEAFPGFQNYFPPANETWGQGKIIVTSRDSNIQNMRTIATVIQINELTPTEKHTLFMKILHHGLDQSELLSEKEDINAFLKFIPPFPLDVSVAAYYIKSTHITYEKYLKILSQCNKDFIDVQENILKGTNDYPKVRYSIITLSLDELIELHKDFPYLLLFISLVDSQNIPRDLLEKGMNDVRVDDFIFNLKKYSLITNHSSAIYPWGTTFSIHRSTQEASLIHLRDRLALKPQNPLLQRITQNLEDYIKQPLEKEDLSQLRLLTTHYEAFLSHPQLLTEDMRGSLLGNLGGMYLSLGKYGKAKRVLKDALLKFDDGHKNLNDIKQAQVLAYLGNAYGDLGNYKKAKELLEKSLCIYKKHLPTNHEGTAWVLTYLGNVYRDLGTPEKAKDFLEQSLHIYKTHAPENYAGNARAAAYLGIVCTVLGDYEKAKTLLEQSLHIYRTYLPKNHVGVAWVSAHLGNAYGELGDYGKARQLLEQSIMLYKKHFPEDHIKVGWALSYLGDVYRVTGEYKKAQQALKQSMAIYKKHLPENHIVIAGILVYLSDIHKDLGEYEKAKELLEQSLIIYEKHFPPNHPETAWALAHLGDIYRIMSDFEQAETLLEKSLIIYRQHFPEDHNEVIWALERLRYARSKVSDCKKDGGAKK